MGPLGRAGLSSIGLPVGYISICGEVKKVKKVTIPDGPRIVPPTRAGKGFKYNRNYTWRVVHFETGVGAHIQSSFFRSCLRVLLFNRQLASSFLSRRTHPSTRDTKYRNVRQPSLSEDHGVLRRKTPPRRKERKIDCAPWIHSVLGNALLQLTD